MKSHLTPIALVSLCILSASAVLNYTTTNNKHHSTEKGCMMTVEGFIRKDTTGGYPKLVFISKDNSIFQPIIESSNCTLTENTHVEICASSIDSSDSTHKTIHINKVVFLP